MDRNGQVRKEPTLADLEAFEQLLRESLQTGPATAPARPAETHAANPLVHNAPAPEAAAPTVSARNTPVVEAPAPAVHSDQAAMAELARLIETPVDFVTDFPPPTRSAPPTAPAPAAEPEHTSGHVEAQMLPGWQTQPVIAAHPAPVVEPAPEPVVAPPPAAEALDPLAAFEEELRRFDAARLRGQTQPAAYDPPIEDLRPAYPAEAAQAELPPPPAAQPAYAPDPAGYEPAGYEPAASMENWQHQAYEPPEEPVISPAEASLKATEERLAQEAAAGAARAGTVRNVGRSKGIFLAMSGIAAAGLAVVAGSFLFSSGSKVSKSGDVPVIAAKTQPAKEKPANPGGTEIPNQNAEVLNTRTRTEVKPAQVINNTEQPLDLNQVTKRDPVRVVAPNPYQSGAPAADAARTAPASEPQPGATGPGVEPRRVTSVRIPIPGAPASAGAAPSVASAPAAPVPTVSAPAIAVPTTSAPTPTPVPAPLPPQRAATPDAPVKVESRPVTANSTPRAETTPAAPAPVRVAPPAPKTEPRRTANAPLSLSPAATPARTRPAASGGSGWAIQLASRPTEADAKSAAGQLKSRYASAIGARSPVVVSGEANGKTVYRVRVTGFDQAGAGAACQKVKAAGGGCFVTRQ